MKTMKLLFAGLAVFAISASAVAQPKPWVVPASCKSKANPVAMSDASKKAGMDTL